MGFNVLCKSNREHMKSIGPYVEIRRLLTIATDYHFQDPNIFVKFKDLQYI